MSRRTGRTWSSATSMSKPGETLVGDYFPTVMEGGKVLKG